MTSQYRYLEINSPSPDGSVILGFLVIISVSLAAFIWMAGAGNEGFGAGIRIYQAPQAMLQTAEGESPESAIDGSIKTSSVANGNNDSQ